MPPAADRAFFGKVYAFPLLAKRYSDFPAIAFCFAYIQITTTGNGNSRIRHLLAKSMSTFFYFLMLKDFIMIGLPFFCDVLLKPI